MRLSIFDHIGPRPAPALSAEFRAQIRRANASSAGAALTTESGLNLTAGLVRFLTHPDARPTWWVTAPSEAEATQFALRAIERAMRVQQGRGRATQFVVIRLPLLTVWPDSNSARDVGSALGRSIEHVVTHELLSRMRQRAGSDEAAATIERLESTLRGLVHRSDIEATVRDLYGTSAAAKIAGRRVADALWLGVQIRANRVANDPGPWLLQALHKETDQLADTLTSKQRGTAADVRVLQNLLDFGFPSIIGLLTFAASSLILPPLSAIGLGMMLGGMTAFRRARGGTDVRRRRRGWSAMVDAFDDDEMSEQAVNTSDVTVDETRPMTDAVEGNNALHTYVRSARAAGLIPILVIEQAAIERDGLETHHIRLRRLLGHVPRGLATLIIGGTTPRPESVPNIDDVAVYRPSETAISDYVDKRIDIENILDGDLKPRLALERVLTRLIVLEEAQGDLEAVDTALSALREMQDESNGSSLNALMQMRIRATFKLAKDTILRESTAEMNADDVFAKVLSIALSLPASMWSQGRQPRMSDAIIEGYLAEVRTSTRWSEMSRSTQIRLRTALKKFLELCSSRVWLVSMLREPMTPYAHIIPEWPLVVRLQGSWHWTFHHDGSPKYQRHDLGLFYPSAGGTAVPQVGEAAMIQSAKPSGERPPVMSMVDRDDESVEYLGDFTLARIATQASSVDDLDDDISRLTQRLPETHRESAWESAHDVLDMLETLDEILGQLMDGELSAKVLRRCGLLPMVPGEAALKVALNDDTASAARYILAETVVRVRQRIGIIDKFVLWIVALNTLSNVRPRTSDIARLLVRARGLRGRTVAEQHARLSTRSLHAELRALCPSTRGADTFFRRTVLKVDDTASLRAWGHDLRARAESLAWSLRDGVTPGVIVTFGWNSIARRLRRLALDGESVFPTFAEKLAMLDRVDHQRLSNWPETIPTVSQLTEIMTTPASMAPEQSLTVARASAMLLLGVNGDGLRMPEVPNLDLSYLDPILAGRFEDAGPAKRPHCVFVRHAHQAKFLSSPPPIRGSVAIIDTLEATLDGRFPKPDAIVIDYDQPAIPETNGIPCIRMPRDSTLTDAIKWVERYVREV